jgi:hypothetical protein
MNPSSRFASSLSSASATDLGPGPGASDQLRLELTAQSCNLLQRDRGRARSTQNGLESHWAQSAKADKII